MSKFMKMLNNISRSQAIFRRGNVSAKDLKSSHYAFALAISACPGRSQEELARELCLNKSTVARKLTDLEENGYVTRTAHPSDKRQFSVHPTKKMLAVLPEIKAASMELAVISGTALTVALSIIMASHSVCPLHLALPLMREIKT